MIIPFVRPLTRGVAGALLPVTVLLSGCSLLPQRATPTATATATGAAASSTGGDTSAAQAESSTGATSGPADLPVLAQAKSAATKNIPLRVSVNRLTVQGQLLQLTFSVANTGDPVGGVSWQVAQFFGDGINQASGAYGTADAFTVDGVYLLDAKKAKRYLVARDPNRVCACSGALAATHIDPGASATFTATFKAPPGDVSALAVVVPHTPPFENLAVQR